MTADQRIKLRNKVNELERQLRQADRRIKPARLREFLALATRRARGSRIIVRDFRERFLKWLPKTEQLDWTRKLIASELRRYRTLRYGTMNRLAILDTTFKRA